MTGKPTIEAYRQRLLEGGGFEAVRAQRGSGKLTARERVDRILDAGSFVETDVFLKTAGASGEDVPAEGVVAGFGLAGGRPVYLYAQDYTVMAGSVGKANAAKIVKIVDLAMKTGVPVVSVLDSAGARIEEGVAALEGYAGVYGRCALASGVVPQIAVVCGPCVGAAAVAAAMADFVFAVDGMSAMLSAGPQVLEASGGRDVLKNAPAVNRSAGLVHFAYPDEASCFRAVKKLLSLLPANNLEDAPPHVGSDDMNRTAPQLNGYDETRDMAGVLSAVADGGDFMESMAGYGPSIITGIARLNGRAVGVVASNPAAGDGRVGGAEADKAARFVAVCDAFNLPVVTFLDTPGLAVSMDEERSGLVRRCAGMAAAYAQASVPKITVVAGRAVGCGWLLAGGRAAADMVYAWPGAVIAPMDPAAAALIVYRDDIAAAADVIAAKADCAGKYAREDAGALAAARAGIVDDVFDPESTRPMLAAALEMLCSKRENRLPRKRATV